MGRKGEAESRAAGCLRSRGGAIGAGSGFDENRHEFSFFATALVVFRRNWSKSALALSFLLAGRTSTKAMQRQNHA
jgi:hypothetical protein